MRTPPFHQSWQALGATPPQALAGPRLVVLHALRVVTHAAEKLAEPAESQPVGWLEWLADHHALATPVIRGARGARVAFRPGELTLLLLDVDGAAIKTRPLEGCRVQEANEWLQQELDDLGADGSQIVGGPSGDVSDLPEELGGVLGCPDRQAFDELERWLVNGDHVLRAIARGTQDASAVRCPAERVELMTLLQHRAREGEQGRWVSVGVSAGDDDHPVPHFFVGARPIDEAAAPSGEGLHWERRGAVVRAILPASAIVSHHDGEAQAAEVEGFLERAIPAAHAVVHREWRRR